MGETHTFTSQKCSYSTDVAGRATYGFEAVLVTIMCRV